MYRIVLFISSLFISCNQVVSESNTSFERVDSVKYTYKSAIGSSQYFIHRDDQIDTTFCTIEYPLFDEDSVNTMIRSSILLDGEENTDQAIESFIHGFDEFVEEVSTNNINAGWSKNVISKVLTNTNRIIVLQTDVTEYTGGAHHSYYTVLSNYDLVSRKKIKLNDLLITDKYEELVKISEKYFRAQEKLTDTASLSKDFFFDNGIFTINDNFGLTKNGLIIYYNVYEIKSFAEGPTVLEIPYAAINNVLNERSKEYINSIK